jgi:hypothetical protein
MVSPCKSPIHPRLSRWIVETQSQFRPEPKATLTARLVLRMDLTPANSSGFQLDLKIALPPDWVFASTRIRSCRTGGNQPNPRS